MGSGSGADAGKKPIKHVTLEEEITELKHLDGYRVNMVKMIIFWIIVVITGGVFYLLYYWFEKKAITWLYSKTSLTRAQYVLAVSHDNHFEFPEVEPFSTVPHSLTKTKFNIDDTPAEQRMFIFKHLRYQYKPEEDTFRVVEIPKILKDRYKDNAFTPLTAGEHKDIQARIGKNLIDIPIAPIPVLLFREVLHPFFIFQVYSAILWCTEEYYIYSAIILFMALVTASISLWEVRNNLINIRNLSRYECEMTVVRDDHEIVVSSMEIVPGDVVVIQPNMGLPCDMAVLSGSCVVDESMLTGESTPVLKVAIPNGVDTDKIDPRYMLFGGTKASEVRLPKGGKMTAVVMTSGFRTSKGMLVLSILFPKPTHFKFVQESMKFLLGLFIVALVELALTVWQLELAGTPPNLIAQRAFDLITVVVPPALPMAASVGTAFAVGRLRQNKIFCVSLPRINMAGKINYMCFDKTGTLTEEGLDLMGALPAVAGDARFAEFEVGVNQLPHHMKVGMMTCHSLTHIAGVVSGEALELKIFAATDSKLEEPHVSENFDNNYNAIVRNNLVGNFGVLTQFEFVPQLQRMSVMVRDLANNNSYIITKGSPEKLFELSLKESLPLDYLSELNKYTHQGYRVLAMGYRPWQNDFDPNCDKNNLRLEAERDLVFLGFIVMQNKLKPETTGVITELKGASIRSVMVTGDNILTAVCISKECGIADKTARVFLVDIPDKINGVNPNITMVDADNPAILLDPTTLTGIGGASIGKFELAVTGNAFNVLLADFRDGERKYPFEKIITAGAVWARMSPDNKAALVDELMALGWYVSMCGDGANDCIALRTSHVGVSLSQAEASVSAPFTSQVTNISCIPILLKQGRSALATAFQLFRFMALYSMIQFTNAVLLNFNGSFLGNWQYLYQDLWVVFPLALFMGRSFAAFSLSKKRPSGRLFSPHNLTTTIIHILMTIGFQIAIYSALKKQDWYYVIDNVNNDPLETNTTIFECSTIWLFAEIQYLCVSLLFTIDRKFKQPIWTNYYFVGWWAITFVTGICLLFAFQDIMFSWMQIMYMPLAWRHEIFWMAVLNCGCYVIVELALGTAKDRGLFSKGRKVKKHRALKKEIDFMMKDKANNKHKFELEVKSQ